MLVETTKYLCIKVNYDSINLITLYAQFAVTDGFVNVKHYFDQHYSNYIPQRFPNIQSCLTNTFRKHASTDN